MGCCAGQERAGSVWITNQPGTGSASWVGGGLKVWGSTWKDRWLQSNFYAREIKKFFGAVSPVCILNQLPLPYQLVSPSRAIDPVAVLYSVTCCR